jgi:hypothetical protein
VQEIAAIDEVALKAEFARIDGIPEGQRDVATTSRLAVVMQEFSKRGMALPDSRGAGRRWWEFWK